MENSKIITSNEQSEEVKISNQFIFKSSDKLKYDPILQIYKGINKKTNEDIAIKIIFENTEFHYLIHEYSILNNLQNIENFPKIIFFSQSEENVILITNLLGKNLEQLIRNQPTKHFSLKTTLMLSIQILKIIQIFHEKNYIHRNIKPENFLIGLKNFSLINLIGFNLSRYYINQKDNIHIPYKEGKSFIGTIRFCSIYTHFGFEQSRRDDLQSIGFMLIYFIKGSLPWMGIKCKNIKEKIMRIKEKKIEVTPGILCHNVDFSIKSYFDYVLNLKFEEKPNYEFLINLFLDDLKRNNFDNDLNFDWCQRKSISDNKENYNIQSNINNKFYNTFGSQMNFSGSISQNKIKNDNNNYHQITQQSINMSQNNPYNQYYQKNKSVEISFEQTK